MYRQRQAQGFSLVEVLVVLVIIALAGTMLVVGFEQMLKRRTAAAVEDVHAWLQAAADTAVLQSVVLGVTRTDNRLQLLAFYRDDWYLLANQSPLDLGEVQLEWSRDLQENAHMQAAGKDRPRPYLMLTPAGEILPQGQIELSNEGELLARLQWPQADEFRLDWLEAH